MFQGRWFADGLFMRPGGPLWQWFLSPKPQPGLQVDGTVVVVVDPGTVVVVVGAMVVVVGAMVVVVGAIVVVVVDAVVLDVGGVSPLNKNDAVALSPARSPNPITHVAPAACCDAVGGHGNDAASVVASPPLLSVPIAGGPVTPATITNDVVKLPDASVVTICDSGSVQLTGT